MSASTGVTGDAAAVDAGVRGGRACRRRSHLDNHRIVTNPMEPRGAVGLYDPATGRYTLHVSSQSIHANRDHAARALGVRAGAGAVHRARCRRRLRRQELHLCRACADPVGGEARSAGRSNGSPAAARSSSPTTRRATTRPRPTLALDADGQVPGAAGRQRRQSRRLSGGQRRRRADLPVRASAGHGLPIPAIALHVAAVLTNTAPIGVTARPGLCRDGQHHRAADRRGGAAMRLRPRRTAPPQHGAGRGDADDQRVRLHGRQRRLSPRPSTRALAAADVAGFAARRRDSEARGLLRGLGFAYHIKATGGSPHENVDIRFEADGTVSLITGTQTIGQGHETTFPQILADRLGVPNERIRLRPGRHRPDPDRRRPRQLARDLYGRHRDLARLRRDHREGHAASPPRRWKRPRPTSASRTAASSSPAPTASSRCSMSRALGARGGRAARHLSRLDARAHDLPERHACRRGRDRSRHRRGDAGALHRGRRLRRAGQPDDRRRPGAWRDRAGRRPGAAGSTRPTTRNPASWWPARSWTTRCRAPTICRRSSSASTARAARPIRSA